MGTRYLLVTDIFGTKHCFWIKNGALFYGPRRTRVTWALVQHSVPNVCIFFCLAGQYASGGKWVPSTYSADLMRELTCPDLACALSRSPKLSLAERTALGCYEVRRGDFVCTQHGHLVPEFDGQSPHGVYVEPLPRCKQRELAEFFDSTHRDLVNSTQCTLPAHMGYLHA